MRLGLCLSLVFCLLVIQASALSLGGSYENDLLTLLQKDGTVGLGDLNRLRLKFDHDFCDRLTVHLEPRYYGLLKSREIAIAGATDLDQLVWDRLYAKYRAENWSLTAGKQRIAWGTGSIWNPVDIFNPLVLSFAVRDDDKTNVEALRWELPLGEAGGIDAFVVTGQPWAETGRGIRVRGNTGMFDLALSYVDQGTLGRQVGFDLAGDIIKDVGVRGELAIKAGPDHNGYVMQAVAGGDYTLENGIGLNAEYYFNGLGSRNSGSYNWGTAESVGMDYLYLSGNKIIDEITTVTVSLLTNLDDQSYLIYPQYSRNVGQNLDLYVEGMWLGGPDGSEFVPPSSADPLGFGGSKMALARLVYSF
ncbi:MAG: hypothetical protein MUC35_04630 [Candidatus Margulisbacteria bacterium]|jgi:hypothetical protein|nr:hypothetical protein [Candidatus Margulisiibacteriota bacterium]